MATVRQDIVTLLSAEPRSVSSLAREMRLRRADIADALAHAIRSARAAGARIHVVPAVCRSCGFTFGAEKFAKPGKCPACRGTRLLEAQVWIERTESS